jgi:hypothetical protein
MPIILERKITRTGGSLEVSIPREIVAMPKLKVGGYDPVHDIERRHHHPQSSRIGPKTESGFDSITLTITRYS